MDPVVDEAPVQPPRGEQAEDIERVVGDLLGRSVKQQDLISTLEYALDRLLDIEWFSFERRGAIFLVDDTGRQLEMTVSRGLPGTVQASCTTVPFGRCLCGRVAESGESLWVETVDERHEVRTGEAEHGHHCVPMKAEGRVVGVINIYVRPEHVCTRAETDMLAAVADVLAGVVQRDQFARARDEHRGRLEAILATFDGLIYMVSPDYRIEYMNDKFMQLVGGDPVSKVCYQAIHGRQDVCPWCTNARVFAGETVRWEVKMRLDGRYYMVVNRPVVHPDGTMSKLSMSTDITERKLAELDLMRALEENTKTLDGVVQTLASTTSQRDPYTAIHQERVARFAVAIAEDMALGAEMTEGLHVAGLLHDIGKIAVPAEILSKPGALTEMEMGIVRTHSTVGHSLLEHVPFKRPIARAVLQHHERLDGSGYPDGRCGDELLLEARILAVADVVEAMASHRPYRPALGIDAALAEVKAKAKILYDPAVVESAVRVIESGAFVF